MSSDSAPLCLIHGLRLFLILLSQGPTPENQHGGAPPLLRATRKTAPGISGNALTGVHHCMNPGSAHDPPHTHTACPRTAL